MVGLTMTFWQPMNIDAALPLIDQQVKGYHCTRADVAWYNGSPQRPDLSLY